MAKYFWAWTEDSENFQEIDDQYYNLPENPTEDELKAVAQELIRDYGDSNDNNDCVYIGEGRQIEAKDVAPGCEAELLIEKAEENAYDRGLYPGDEPLFEPTSQDIDDLDARIEEVFIKWANERKVVMRGWYMIESAKAYYREGHDESI